MSDDDDGPDLSCFNFGADEGEDEKEDRGTMLKRHRIEEQTIRTEAKARIHAIPKGDRPKRDAAEAARESELAEMRVRHSRELADAGHADAPAAEAAAAAVAALSVSGNGKSGKGGGGKKEPNKQEKRRQKKEQEERERESRIADHHSGRGPSERDVEIAKLAAQLSPRGLKLYEIPADGHCLYRSVAHQCDLVFPGGPSGDDFAGCRRDAANYMRAHPADFAPFLAAEGIDLEAYCSAVESSNDWGGQLEITALAHARKRCIEVFSADAPVLLTGEEYDGPRLQLTYHKHYYGLGAHYNAVVPGP
mmetsp:Transcript_20244/g.34459  ORF Transcript_20244/g.34459 Transcript_20244/m.34459 type:complete len:306 (+) Transcript_20244:82-999(+)